MLSQRYIPQDSTPITRENLPAIVYTYTDRNGKIAAIAYTGKSNKPVWHYCFRNETQREARINQLFDTIQSRENFKAERKASRKNFKHGFQVGDILYSSWGYEQTNVEFYQIIATTEKTVTFREVCQTRTRTGHDSGVCAPIRDEFAKDSKEYTRVVYKDGNDDTKGGVSFAEYEGGYIKHLWYLDRPDHYFSDGY